MAKYKIEPILWHEGVVRYAIYKEKKHWLGYHYWSYLDYHYDLDTAKASVKKFIEADRLVNEGSPIYINSEDV